MTSGGKVRPQIGLQKNEKPIHPRAQARLVGAPRFVPLSPCKNGHWERYTRGGSCVECTKSAFDHIPQQPKAEPPTIEKLAERSRRLSEQLSTSYWHKKRGIKIGSAEHKRALAVQSAINRVRKLIYASISRQGSPKDAKSEAILGCSMKFFMSHLERQFLPGMTWANAGKWHIDHIVPVSSAKTKAEVIALNHFTNLRPLWAADNLAKSDKLEFLL